MFPIKIPIETIFILENSSKLNEAGYLYFAIVTSNETYDFPTQSSIFGSDIGTFTLQGSALADMDAGDTAYVHIYQQGGTAQATISHGHTFFNGALIC